MFPLFCFRERKRAKSFIWLKRQSAQAGDRCDASTLRRFNVSQIQLYRAFVLLGWTRRVSRDIGCGVAVLNEFMIDQISFDFLATHIGQHLPVYFDTRRKWLTALGLHLPAKRRILDNVFFCIWKVVFGQHRADTGAPATIGLQICGNFWRLHCRIYHERIPRKDRSCVRVADIFCSEGSFKRLSVCFIFAADRVTTGVQKVAPSLFLQSEKTRRREEKRA